MIIEDGSIVPNAVSWLNATTARSMLASRGHDASLPADDATLDLMLIASADSMRHLDYIGQLRIREQALPWPRAGAVLYTGWSIPHTEIPVELIWAQLYLTYYATQGISTTNLPSPVVKKEEIARAITVEYRTGLEDVRFVSFNEMPLAWNHLSVLLRDNSAKKGGGHIDRG